MIWKKKKLESPSARESEVQQLAATTERLLAEANGAFDNNEFLRAADALLQAAVVSYELARIDAAVRLAEILNEVEVKN